MPILRYNVVHRALPNQALDCGDVHFAAEPSLPAADRADFLTREAQEPRKGRLPLFQELPPVHENERIHPPLCDQMGRNDGFPKGCCCCQDTSIVLEERGSSSMQPRGSPMCSGKSSQHEMMRGLSNVERRMAWAR